MERIGKLTWHLVSVNIQLGTLNTIMEQRTAAITEGDKFFHNLSSWSHKILTTRNPTHANGASCGSEYGRQPMGNKVSALTPK